MVGVATLGVTVSDVVGRTSSTEEGDQEIRPLSRRPVLLCLLGIYPTKVVVNICLQYVYSKDLMYKTNLLSFGLLLVNLVLLFQVSLIQISK